MRIPRNFGQIPGYPVARTGKQTYSVIADGILVVYDESVADVVDGVNQSHPQDVAEKLVWSAVWGGHARQHIDLIKRFDVSLPKSGFSI